jgi:hypothetical protein
MINLQNYFNNRADYDLMDKKGFVANVYTCKQCFSLVLTDYLEKHVEWHSSLCSQDQI